ncbi:TolC family protein [Frigidibacter sp. MR17.14]|uniref:TolC family protein n=1 Tax=Frigidibacter sp. MR17.14 TaxID=3126509 RepID=UPI003012DE79
MKPLILGLSAALTLSACADFGTMGRASEPRAGFARTEAAARSAGLTAAWHLTPAEVAANAARVRARVQGKTVNADTAVQVALVNNRALQARYAELGLSSTELWEAAMGPVPTLGVSATGLAGDAARSLEAALAASLLDIATAKPRTRVAQIRFEQAELAALSETMALAVETRRAWIEAVGAFEAAALIGQTQGTAEAASELAAQLGQTGALNRADQAREHAFTAELAAERAAARLEAEVAKERLLRLMGLWGGDLDVFVPDALPGLPGRPRGAADIERLALQNRPDLASGRLELEAVALDYRLEGRTRMISDVALAAGGEVEREDGETDRTAVLDLDFEIPLYDTGRLVSKRGQMAYLQAANELADQAIAARAEARIAQRQVTGRHAIARQWRDQVVPLRAEIDEQALLSYNGMLTSAFDLLEDARDGLEARLSAAAAKKDYWIAETDVTAAIWGGPISSEGGDE